MGLKEVAKGFKNYNINKDLDKVLKLDDVQTLIIELNTDDNKDGQLKTKGILSDGTEISSFAPYADNTILIKSLQGTLTSNNPDIVNLFDSGEFQRGWFVTITEYSIILDSTDEKRDDLVKRYDEDIFGLTDENINRLIDDLLLELLQEQVRKSANEIISKI